MKLAVVLLLGASCCFAGKLDWLRWGVGAANCGMAMMDVVSTTQGIEAGGFETNPLLLSRGKISWGKLYLVKGVICAAPLVTGEWAHRKYKSSLVDTEFTLGTGGLTLYQGFVVHHNYVILKELNK